MARFLIALGVALVCALPVSAQTTSIVIEPQSTQLSGTGTTITLDVRIEDYTDLANFTIPIFYNESALEIESTSNLGQIFTSEGLSPFCQNTSNDIKGKIQVDCGGLGTNSVSGADGLAYTVTLNAVDEGGSDLIYVDLSNTRDGQLVRLRDPNNDPIPYTGQKAVVTVTSPLPAASFMGVYDDGNSESSFRAANGTKVRLRANSTGGGNGGKITSALYEQEPPGGSGATFNDPDGQITNPVVPNRYWELTSSLSGSFDVDARFSFAGLGGVGDAEAVGLRVARRSLAAGASEAWSVIPASQTTIDQENQEIQITSPSSMEFGSGQYALVYSALTHTVQGMTNNNEADAGWRLLALPVSGTTVGDLSEQNLVQGVNGSFPGVDPNLLVDYNTTNANPPPPYPYPFVAPAGTSTQIESGRGFFWFFFDNNNGESEELPFTLQLPGPVPAGDVTVTGLEDTEQWHMLGNPYNAPIDLAGALDLSGNGFQETVFYDPDPQGDGNNSGYQMVTSGDPNDEIGTWTGFWVERTAPVSGEPTELTFDEAATTSSRSRVGPVAIRQEGRSMDSRAWVAFRLTATDENGTEISRDETIRAYFHPQAETDAWDAWDASKPPAVSATAATMAFEGPKFGETVQQAQRSMPLTLADPVTVPLRLKTSNLPNGASLTLTWPELYNLPDGWGVTLRDQQTDQEMVLQADTAYTFAPATQTSQSTSDDSARFELRIGPDVIPVELTSFTAHADDRAAVLNWKTATETGSDGFRIEQRNGGGERWKKVVFVESQASGGTSGEPLSYTRRIEGLGYGTHEFRLVQRDLDGGEALVGEAQRVEVNLNDDFSLSPAYPNPFHEQATVELAVKAAQTVTASLHDALGRRVRILYKGMVEANETQRLAIDAGGLASGVYLLRVTGEDFVATRKVVLVQ